MTRPRSRSERRSAPSGKRRLGVGAVEDARQHDDRTSARPGPPHQRLQGRVTAALAARKEVLKGLALDQRLNTDSRGRHAAVRSRRPRPPRPSIAKWSTSDRDLRGLRLRGRRRARQRTMISTSPSSPSLKVIPRADSRHVHFNPKPDGSRLLSCAPTPRRCADPHHAGRRSRPIRVIIPGRTYRATATIPTRRCFHQVEGLVIDRARTSAT